MCKPLSRTILEGSRDLLPSAKNYRLRTPGARLFRLALVASTLCITGAAQKVDHVMGRLVVQHRVAADVSDDLKTAERSGARLRARVAAIRVSVLDLPEAALDNVARALENSKRFTFVERDFVGHGALVPNDPQVGSQWHVNRVEAPAAWGLTTGSTAIPIAVVDSGVDGGHPDFAGKLLAGWNFLGSNSDTSDVLGHGTAVAGAAGAATDNGVGVAGIGWRTPIMPLVVLDASDYASYSNVANAIIYAADHGVRIINVSISGSSSSSLLQSAIDYAWNKGALVFAAAGNNSSSAPTYPAACNHAIAVSSTESDDTFSGFSNYGSWITLSAPGNYILTTNRGGGYGQWQGTSFASPIAAGVAALVWSARPALDRDSVLNILKQNADDLGAFGFDQQFGYGRVNAFKAVNAALSIGSDLTAPRVSIMSPGSGSTVSGTVMVSGSGTDNVGVSKCDLYVDANLTATGSASFGFAWNSGNVSNGGHSLEVRCTDSSANVGSSAVGVQVNNVAATDGPVAPPTPTPAPTPVPMTSSIFGPNAPTNSVWYTDLPVELGMKFRSDVSGKVYGVRFYKNAGETGPHTGSLWTATGQLLATGTFIAESASGWQQLTFANPVTIAANTSYVVSYHTNAGFTASWYYFQNNGVDNGPLHTLKDGTDGATTVFAYGAGGVFPTGTWHSTNYWVDVAFEANVSTKQATLLATTVSPDVPFYRDSPVELGVKFRSDVAGQVKGVRFYKGLGDTGAHTGSLWSSTGQLLATGRFTGETASGWQVLNFATPVVISANTTYIASYWTQLGFPLTQSAFYNAGIDNAPLHLLKEGVDGSNSVYKYGPGGVFPTDSYKASNYFADVLFSY